MVMRHNFIELQPLSTLNLQTNKNTQKQIKTKQNGPSTSVTIHDDQPSLNLTLSTSCSPLTSIIN
jgi:hypothetical protein